MITVLADDITGAAEIAGVCLRYELTVTFDFDFNINQLPETDVWIIASDTRSMTEAEACETVRKTARCLKELQVKTVFKKIDSALRGHILPEINALQEYIPVEKIFILPANPESGRIIRKGHYYINETPLHQTAFAGDPDFPAKSSWVKEIIRLPDDENLILPDIVSEKDYSNYAGQLTPTVLPVGASAFFEACLQVFFPWAKKTERKRPELGKNRVVICGSTHEANRNFLRSAKDFDVVEIALNEVNLLLENPEIFRKRMSGIQHVFDCQKRLIVCMEREKANPALSEKIKRLLALIANYLLENATVEELFLTGGATAYSCLPASGFSSLVPVYEYARGVVRMEIPARKNLHVTIKPGSYSWSEKIMSGNSADKPVSY